jgi:hypothetical protein
MALITVTICSKNLLIFKMVRFITVTAVFLVLSPQ